MRTLSPRLNLGKLILALALLSAIIALANTLLASYRVQRDQLVGNTLEANRVYATKLAETTQNFLLAAQQELAYAATRPGDEMSVKLMAGLLSRQQNGQWGNTQENVFGVMAVAAAVGRARGDAPEVGLAVNGRAVDLGLPEPVASAMPGMLSW